MIDKPRSAGFTLLELLLAMGVSTMIAVLAYAAISSAIAANNGMHREVRLMSDLQRALDIIELDVGGMLSRRNQTLQGGVEPALLGGANHDPLLQFTRGGVDNPSGLPRSDMQRVRYVLSGTNLWRQHRWQLDGADPNQVADSTMLLEDVRQVRLEFLPRQLEQSSRGVDPLVWSDLLPWVDAWDSEHLQVGQQHPLPLALRMTIDIEGFGSVQRIYGLP